MNPDPALFLVGDALTRLRELPDQSVQTCITSPPYWGLRDYGVDGQLGLERTPEEYVTAMVGVFREVHRVLKDDGILWLNLGDSYASDTKWGGSTGGKHVARLHGDSKIGRGRTTSGLPTKNLVGIPWRIAFALQDDGWILRADIVWHKLNPMPESVRDRPTRAHEFLFMLTKNARYYYDADAIREPMAEASAARYQYAFGGAKNEALSVGDKRTAVVGDRIVTEGRNKRDVWSLTNKPYRGAHYAVMPPELARPCVLASTRTAGRRCDCDTIISTPTGSGVVEDPTLLTGRKGLNRPRRPEEGSRPITRREQRHEAREMKGSPHRGAMREACGSAFEHYIRTDGSGARPLPEALRQRFRAAGWLTQAPPCPHDTELPDIVLDPFNGAATTGLVALQEGRRYVGIDLNPANIELSKNRVQHLLNQLFMQAA